MSRARTRIAAKLLGVFTWVGLSSCVSDLGQNADAPAQTGNAASAKQDTVHYARIYAGDLLYIMESAVLSSDTSTEADEDSAQTLDDNNGGLEVDVWETVRKIVGTLPADVRQAADVCMNDVLHCRRLANSKCHPTIVSADPCPFDRLREDVFTHRADHSDDAAHHPTALGELIQLEHNFTVNRTKTENSASNNVGRRIGRIQSDSRFDAYPFLAEKALNTALVAAASTYAVQLVKTKSGQDNAIESLHYSYRWYDTKQLYVPEDQPVDGYTSLAPRVFQSLGPNPATAGETWDPILHPIPARWVEGLDLLHSLETLRYKGKAVSDAIERGAYMDEATQRQKTAFGRKGEWYRDKTWWPRYLEGAYALFGLSELSSKFLIYPRLSTLPRSEGELAVPPDKLQALSLRYVDAERTERGFAAKRLGQLLAGAYIGLRTAQPSGKSKGKFMHNEVKFGKDSLQGIKEFEQSGMEEIYAQRLWETIKLLVIETVTSVLVANTEWATYVREMHELSQVENTTDDRFKVWQEGVTGANEYLKTRTLDPWNPGDAALALGLAWASKIQMERKVLRQPARGCTDDAPRYWESVYWRLIWRSLPGDELGTWPTAMNPWVRAILAARYPSQLAFIESP